MRAATRIRSRFEPKPPNFLMTPVADGMPIGVLSVPVKGSIGSGDFCVGSGGVIVLGRGFDFSSLPSSA